MGGGGWLGSCLVCRRFSGCCCRSVRLAFNTFFQLFGDAKLKLLCLVLVLPFREGVAPKARGRWAAKGGSPLACEL